jgi:hypothetical protein
VVQKRNRKTFFRLAYGGTGEHRLSPGCVALEQWPRDDILHMLCTVYTQLVLATEVNALGNAPARRLLN